jgi:hypothetical protein
MLAFPAIEFPRLGCSEWEHPGICCDAFPDFLDQAEPLLDTEAEDLFNADAHERRFLIGCHRRSKHLRAR